MEQMNDAESSTESECVSAVARRGDVTESAAYAELNHTHLQLVAGTCLG